MGQGMGNLANRQSALNNKTRSLYGQSAKDRSMSDEMKEYLKQLSMEQEMIRQSLSKLESSAGGKDIREGGEEAGEESMKDGSQKSSGESGGNSVGTFGEGQKSEGEKSGGEGEKLADEGEANRKAEFGEKEGGLGDITGIKQEMAKIEEELSSITGYNSEAFQKVLERQNKVLKRLLTYEKGLKKSGEKDDEREALRYEEEDFAEETIDITPLLKTEEKQIIEEAMKNKNIPKEYESEVRQYLRYLERDF